MRGAGRSWNTRTACPSFEHTASVVPSAENLSAQSACGRDSVNCATGSGSADDNDGDEDARRGWRSTTVMLQPAVSDTGDVGGGGSGSELGVTVACGSKPSTDGDDTRKLRRRQLYKIGNS